MSHAEFFAELAHVPGLALRTQEPLHRHTPLRVGGPAEIWADVDELSALQALLTAARREKLTWRVCWPLCDWLVRDGGVRGLTIRPGRAFEAVERVDGGVRIGAAAPWASLGTALGASLARLSTWSGSVGGLFALGEAARLDGHLLSVRWLRGRRVEEVAVTPGEIPVLPATAVLLDITLSAEPLLRPGRRRPTLDGPPPPGTLFQAPDNLPLDGLFSRANLGGSRLRCWRITGTGAAVQLGGGSCRDVLLLVQGLVERMQKERGIALQTRLPVLGVEADVVGVPS